MDPGALIAGRYVVERELGRGGMGAVYLARSSTGTPFAVEVMLRRASADGLARFRREQRLLSSFGEADGLVPVLENGKGASKDEAEAVKWYQAAARTGDPDAKASLRRLGRE